MLKKLLSHCVRGRRKVLDAPTTPLYGKQRFEENVMPVFMLVHQNGYVDRHLSHRSPRSRKHKPKAYAWYKDKNGTALMPKDKRELLELPKILDSF